jgi:hypothetical protein
MLGDQHQRFDRRAPRERVVLALRQFGDVVAGVARAAQLVTVRQRDRIVEGAVPVFATHRAAGIVPDLTFGADIKLNKRHSFTGLPTPDMFAGHFSKKRSAAA